MSAESHSSSPSTVDEATIIFSSSEGDEDSSATLHRSLAEVTVGTSPSQDAYRALRQSRLRAAVLFLAVWWGVILFQGLLGGAIFVHPTFVVGSLLAAHWFLSPRQPRSAAALRVVEVASFGLVAGSFVWIQADFMGMGIERSDAQWAKTAIKDGLINSLTLLLAYTLLVPNTVRAAVPMVVGLAIYPLVTAGIVFAVHPASGQVARSEMWFEVTGMNLTMTLVAMCLSLFGVHILETLRQDVFEARRLNQYQLGERLGSGGMGDVFRAEHRLLKRNCAIKLIRSDRAGDRKALARLEREVQAMARLSHPNIVDVYDYGHTDDGTFYYVMEELHGLNLEDLVEQHGPLPPERVTWLLRQTCDGLAEAHASGLIHRDLKPANIFAANIGRRYDVAKVLDFGLVKESVETSISLQKEQRTNPSIAGTLLGTPKYMAPEQASSSTDVDHRADLYAVGAVAYFLLTGRPPFDGDNIMSVLIAHARDPVEPPSRWQPVPDELEKIVLRCLEKAPSDRYPDAQSLSTALSTVSKSLRWNQSDAAEWWRANPVR
ncbi:MAG: serine/threonine protein kinase [Planctomycetaceae bacterium]|nr:serine/threonine protein kinase [Planctomycetaceae bacterium]